MQCVLAFFHEAIMLEILVIVVYAGNDMNKIINVTIQRNIALKLSRCGDISPGGGCKPLADLSCVPLEVGEAMFALFAVALW